MKDTCRRVARRALTVRCIGGALLCALSIPVAASCSTESKKPGQLILAIQADMKVPDDVDEIRIEILAFGRQLHASSYPLGPEHEVRIPATLAILGAEDPSIPVTIRVISRQNAKLRTLRQVVTTVPAERSATLRMPIQWLCDGQAVEPAPNQVDSTCPDNQTCVAGRCVEDAVDSNTLPDFAPGDVYGGGSGEGDGSCLDTVACFAGGTGVVLDEDCTFTAPNLESLNVALVLAPGGDGICGPEACLVPLDQDADSGWVESGGRIVLPPAVCERIGAGSALGVAVTNDCPTKTPSVPTCGPWSAVTEQPADFTAPAPENVALSGCAAPSNAARSAVCITLEPEAVTALPGDPELDGKGTLVVEAYDTPDFINATPIATVPLEGDFTVDALPSVRLDDLPETVYLFAALWDNPNETSASTLRRGGGFVGGLAPSSGLTALAPVTLEPGAGHKIALPLTALRRLRMTVSLAADAVVADDGGGWVQWLSYASEAAAVDAAVTGVSERVCGTLTASPQVVEGFVLGPGPHYVVATLDDYGLGLSSLAPPGSLGGSVVSGSPGIDGVWNAPDTVSFQQTAYTSSKLLQIGHLVPIVVAPTSFRCASSECNDSTRNGTETDVDCGGSCTPCLDGQTCAGPADCTSRVCIGNLCQAPSCTDGVQNAVETDVDCGGATCAPCGAGLGCLSTNDCSAGSTCVVNVCSGGSGGVPADAGVPAP